MPGYRNNGRGLKLMSFAEELAQKLKYRQVIVTVSETKEKSFRFFINNDFFVINKKKGKYQDGIIEYVLKKEIA
jgi:ribosomal protein S18 acetylase RimI-like enzyme